ncbi:CRISPR-associated protein Cmr4 [Methylomagnum ishizawai]|uniref:CRISPR-associated protein Cmr4 n=1 Tax=Methylomagnum ishizawai TaxID=1760988 RepID=A0A1Y6D3X1_9GAMM|nr:type III-B CRISPR module RAMP protein Cmr4 [Methylomagnum ishizawai]SMF95242.1 CRISPR-associated protein Cmr4 [Methylomagnum ishizawai]
MPQTTALLGLLAETPLHAGTGQTFGLIDLPIQREAHTDWPCVYGSAMKGALRARAEDLYPDQRRTGWIVDVFGPEATPEKGDGAPQPSDHGGALAVTDARLLLLPVRSLTGFYKWVTCPALLRRFGQDRRRLLGEEPFALAEAALPKDDGKRLEAVVCQDGGDLFLEEFRFVARTESKTLEPVVGAIAPLLGGNPAKPDLRQRLAVVGDDLFTHLARFATAVAAHIRIEGERKTVRDGALWYEETLPPDTVLYTGLLAAASRREGATLTAADILAHATRSLFPAGDEYLQVGGNETVGMGWCRVVTIGRG